jgi:hypothetical protein
VSLSAIPRPLRVAVFQRDGGRCRYCLLHQVGQAAVFHVDHIIPKSKGGETMIENLALQCPHCSLHKASKTHGVDPLDGAIVPLFHPLRNVWAEHFHLTAEGNVSGTSAVGRATVDALQMNTPLVRTARAMQTGIGFI